MPHTPLSKHTSQHFHFKQMSSVFLVQWNLNGYFTHKEVLNLLIKDQNPSVLCLQETHLKHTKNDYAPRNYKGFYKNREDQGKAAGEGSQAEGDRKKKVREDKRRIAKTLRNQGETYISPVTKKIVKEKALKGICNIAMCKKRKRMCYLFSSPLRTMIFSQLHSLGDLQQQREYVARFVLSENPKHRTTNSNDRRRKQTHYFVLPLEGTRQLVCKKMFLGTLGISEKVCRTAIKKLNRTTGVLEKKIVEVDGSYNHQET
ncbi:unnamed protein product [Acanthoscelides obtectus]|uniref:Endonuclease/exonuclease/phosphatase domain-containing protein n=1 Tax=Acanthoscelides obtectus TaxID=200917 RepID=A0A9P0L5N0_ACAOB|nr:unnamed protein product [Acanthoscelides obtectus]CAK1632731.1 hypothetical protein AOBTE_LOCUS7702 [Acanthoscelides obtectus]